MLYCERVDKRQPVCIPFKRRVRHMHLIGRAGTGKTSVMERMILDDVRRGVGLIIIDPQGDLCERMLCLLPGDAVERTVYLGIGDPDWIPLWNPFRRTSDESVGQVVDGLVRVLMGYVQGFGDRLEHILRNVLYLVLSLPRGTLVDASNLMRTDSSESRQLVQRALETIDNESVRRFWEQEFRHYRTRELSPLRNKFGQLFAADSLSLMLSQPDNVFDLREIMDEGRILLVNLSRIESQARGIVGSILLALLHQATLRRTKTPDAHCGEAHIYCDEAQHFLTAPFMDLIAEARRYNVGLTLAYRYVRQFDHATGDPRSSVGSTIIFGVDRADAVSLTKDLGSKVTAEDLIGQPDYHAIVRVGQQIGTIRTYEPQTIKGTGHHSQIIENSRRLYCKPTADVVAAIRRCCAESV